MSPEFDDRDREILAERVAMLNEVEGPREGDFVIFVADDITRRISYIWRDEHGIAFNVQTSDGASYYLGGNGWVSVSGSHYSGVKPETLTPTDQVREGSVWFFHHDAAGADCGVYASMDFRVYTCTQEAPQ